jgi:hypothetical protein
MRGSSKRAEDAAEIIHPVYSWVKSALGRTENHLRLGELAMKLGYSPELRWQSVRFAKSAKPKDSKTKFTCPTPTCGQNMWGKPTADIICGVCYKKTGKIVAMVAEPGKTDESEGLDGGED